MNLCENTKVRWGEVLKTVIIMITCYILNNFHSSYDNIIVDDEIIVFFFQFSIFNKFFNSKFLIIHFVDLETDPKQLWYQYPQLAWNQYSIPVPDWYVKRDNFLEGKKKSWKILNIILPKMSTIFLPSAKKQPHSNYYHYYYYYYLFLKKNLTPRCCPKATMSPKKKKLKPRCWISDPNIG